MYAFDNLDLLQNYFAMPIRLVTFVTFLHYNNSIHFMPERDQQFGYPIKGKYCLLKKNLASSQFFRKQNFRKWLLVCF